MATTSLFTTIAAVAFTPFSAGFVGGSITGMLALKSRWHRLGPIVWFICWILLYTTGSAIRSDHPMLNILPALEMACLWGVLPFVVTFYPSRSSVEKLRALIADTDKRKTLGN